MLGTAFGLLVQHLGFAGPPGAYGLVGMGACSPAQPAPRSPP
jgi:H+/Cl- antiporter ClcA